MMMMTQMVQDPTDQDQEMMMKTPMVQDPTDLDPMDQDLTDQDQTDQDQTDQDQTDQDQVMKTQSVKNHTTIPNPDHGMPPTLDLIWVQDQAPQTNTNIPVPPTQWPQDLTTVSVSVHQTTLTPPDLTQDHQWDHLINLMLLVPTQAPPQVPLMRPNGPVQTLDPQWDHLTNLTTLDQTVDHHQVPLMSPKPLDLILVHHQDHLTNTNTPDPQTP
jgi:hypothetical protein